MPDTVSGPANPGFKLPPPPPGTDIKTEAQPLPGVVDSKDATGVKDKTLDDPQKSANIIWRFMKFELDAMAQMQDEIFGPIDPTTGQRSGGLMGTLNDQNASLSEINNFLTQATQAQQADSDDQPISEDMVNYLAETGGGVDPKTGEPANPLGLTKDENGHWNNDYIKWDDGLTPPGYKVTDKKQWQTITTELNGDSNTIRNDSQTTTIQINAKLTQFQNIQQSMQQAIQGIAGALNQLIQGAAR